MITSSFWQGGQGHSEVFPFTETGGVKFNMAVAMMASVGDEIGCNGIWWRTNLLTWQLRCLSAVWTFKNFAAWSGFKFNPFATMDTNAFGHGAIFNPKPFRFKCD